MKIGHFYMAEHRTFLNGFDNLKIYSSVRINKITLLLMYIHCIMKMK